MTRRRLDIPTVMIRVSVETHDALAELAKKHGCPIRELVSRMMEETENEERKG